MIIEQRRAIGTANHVFHAADPVAYTETVRDEYWPEVATSLVVRSLRTHEELAEITTSLRVHARYDGNREEFLGQGETFAQCLMLALGKPGYGHGWYGIRGHGRLWAPRAFALLPA
jgi:hypothetical protein